MAPTAATPWRCFASSRAASSTAPGERPDRVHWGHVGSAASLPEKLMELAVGLAIGPDGCEQAARSRLEEALCAADEDVGDALIDAI